MSDTSITVNNHAKTLIVPGKYVLFKTKMMQTLS